ncbi:uncharacterized protein LOC124930200 [Impatiens glandulifera]|uniref:uncharacterized protein LOC124930200 n=1 Tax=Impatiens glandulifera TaxID=253017 RepID=UPI001FB06DB4|nr:uncharacterized protein LOC124930200 [Impatiens glandulifera]
MVGTSSRSDPEESNTETDDLYIRVNVLNEKVNKQIKMLEHTEDLVYKFESKWTEQQTRTEETMKQILSRLDELSKDNQDRDARRLHDPQEQPAGNPDRDGRRHHNPQEQREFYDVNNYDRNPRDRNNRPYHIHKSFTRIDFPKFDGNDVDGWIYAAEEFFEVDNTPLDIQPRIARLHFKDKARLWYTNFRNHLDANFVITWDFLKTEIKKKFGHTIFDDPMGELMNLKQVGPINEHNDKFIEISYRLPLMPNDYMLNCYLGGIRKEIANSVRLLHPNSLNDAMAMARVQEATYDSLKVYLHNNGPPLLPTPKPTKFQWNNNNRRKDYKKLDPKFMAEKRAKNECYYCTEKFNSTHKCKGEFYMLENSELIDESQPELDDLLAEDVDELSGISLNAINGPSSYRTLCLPGKIGKINVEILIDSGSTHNFINSKWLPHIKDKLIKTSTFSVSVADGNQLPSCLMYQQILCTIQDYEFMTDLRVLTMPKYDVILGIEWLVSLSDIHCDFLHQKFSFLHKNGRVTLRGNSDAEICSILGAHNFNKYKRPTTILIDEPFKPHFYSLATNNEYDLPKEKLDSMLDEFQELFQEPKGLPPHRPHDHCIHLKEGSTPISLSPYRYSAIQKTEIEKLVSEMLE